MDIAFVIGCVLWILIGIVVLVLVLIVLGDAAGRARLRTWEATDASARGVFHFDIRLDEVPRTLRRFIATIRPDLEKLGFKELLTGVRLKLSEGGADNYYHIMVSPDKTTLAEISHIRVGRVLGIWPVQLPLSTFIGPVTMSITLESFFTDCTSLVTSTLGGWKDPPPPWHVVEVAPDVSRAELWNRHKAEHRKLISEAGKTCLLLDSREAYFEKERIQREQMARQMAMRTRALREVMEADCWGSKGDENGK